MRKQKGFSLLESLIVIAIVLIILSVVFAGKGFAQPDHARKVLENNGYTEVQMTGYRWLGCGEGDIYRDGFKAKSPAGIVVTGVVCSGWLKKATIRFD